MLLASDCKEAAIITQHMTTKTKILRVVFLKIRPFRLRFITRLTPESARFPVTFLSLLFLDNFCHKAAKSRSRRQPKITCTAGLAGDRLFDYYSTDFLEREGFFSPRRPQDCGFSSLTGTGPVWYYDRAFLTV